MVARRMGQTTWRITLPVSAALAAGLIFAQQPAADEVRVSGQPYVQQAPMFRADVKLVDAGVVVRDGHGRPVAGLKQSDFRILDDGKEQKIAAFSEVRAAGSVKLAAKSAAAADSNVAAVETATASAAPATVNRARYLAVFFDDVNMAYGEEAGDLKRAQSAAEHYVKTLLRPGVQIAIFTASGSPGLDFTRDAEKLLAAIGQVKAHPQYSQKACSGMNPYQAYRIAVEHDRETMALTVAAENRGGCPSATPGSANGVRLQAEQMWDRIKEMSSATLGAVRRAVNQLSAKPGERVLMLASAGFVGQTLELQQDKIIDEAVRSGVTINALVTKGLYNELPPGERFDQDPQPGKAIYTVLPGYQRWSKAEAAEVAERPMVMDEAMGNLARGTGGVLFHNNNDLNAGFRETAAAPESSYRIGFTPEGAPADGSYHKLQVKLSHRGSYSVEARPGYFAQDEMAPESLRAALDKEVMGTDAMSGVAARVSLQIEKLADDRRIVHVIAHVDVSKLEFLNQNERRNQRLTFVAAFFDAQGKMVAAKEGRIDLALTPETFGRLSASGVNGELSFPLQSGEYKLRAVMTEAVKGGMAASTYPVEVK